MIMPRIGQVSGADALLTGDIVIFGRDDKRTNIRGGGIAGRVIGGPPKATLDGGKSIANFWPTATTVFDFIRRAMPYQAPGTLTNQEVYAVTAYLLAGNKLIGENDTIDAQTLPKVKMPNRDNFIIRFPERI